MKESRKLSIKVSFCGLMAALSVVILFLTGLIPVATIALPAVAGCMLIPVVGELGKTWGLGVYAVCAVLSFLLTPDREAALIYTLFFGYYPILTAVLGRIGKKPLRWAAKLLVFNAAAALEVVLATFVLGIPWETLNFLGPVGPVVLLLLANVVFVLYDLTLDRLIVMYFQKLHRRIHQMLKLK